MIANRGVNLLLKPVYLEVEVKKTRALKRFADPIFIFDEIDDDLERGLREDRGCLVAANILPQVYLWFFQNIYFENLSTNFC